MCSRSKEWVLGVLWEKLQLLRPVLVVKTSQGGSHQPVKAWCWQYTPHLDILVVFRRYAETSSNSTLCRHACTLWWGGLVRKCARLGFQWLVLPSPADVSCKEDGSMAPHSIKVARLQVPSEVLVSRLSLCPW